MSRKRDPRRDEALQMFIKHEGNITNRSIAEQLDVPEKTISAWKSRDRWNAVLHGDDRSTTEDKRSTTQRKKSNRGGQRPGAGAPKGNRNAVGNSGGSGGPLRNDKAVTHGLFRRFLPQNEEYLEIFDAAGQTHPLDMLWSQIQIKFANIVHAQRIMFVESKDEMIKELKKQKFEVHDIGTKAEPKLEIVTTEEEYEFQFSWDRQATALNSLSRAMSSLTTMIRQYEELEKSYGNDEERRLRIEKMKADVEKTKVDIDKTRYESEKLKKGTGSQEPLKIIIDYGDVDEPEVEES